MTVTEQRDVHGPVDYLLLEFPGTEAKGGVGEALLNLVEQGIVSVYDLLVIRKEENGAVTGLEITDLDSDSIGGFTAFAGARSGLVGDDDVAEAATAMEPGTTAALLVYENTWAIPFVAAAREAGAQVVASQRIPASVIMEVLDALEAVEGLAADELG